jgi:UDP-glucose 4-epimerase
MVVPSFVRAALAGRDLRVHGDGTQTRCFCHVEDVVKALVGLMSGDEHVGEVFNVGATEEISIGSLAERITALTESDSEIVEVAYDEAYEEGFEDMMRRVPDIRKIGRALGWNLRRLPKTLRKRRDVQRHVRRLTDRALRPHLFRRVRASYYYYLATDLSRYRD